MRNKGKTAVLPGIIAVWCALRAYWHFSAKHLRGAGETIYAGFPALKIADICFAAVLGLIALWWIVCVIRKKGFSSALLAMAAAEIAAGIARFIITGFTPLNMQAALRLIAYVLLIATYYKKDSGGESHAGGQDPVCGGSVLQGGSGAAGDGEAPEGKDASSDAAGENIG